MLELRPSHDPEATWGFVGVVISTADLSASIWRWYRERPDAQWAVEKVITIPAEPADPADLPPALQPFGAVPPLVTDIDLSVDDQMLYVSCWGTGELKQYDVSDPASAARGRVGAARRDRRAVRAHPAAPEERLAGGPQMVEVSRDGRRVYVTNSLYGAWDDQFYPDGVGAWMAKIDADPRPAGSRLDKRFFPHGDEFRGRRRAPGAAAGRGRVLRLLLLPLTPAGGAAGPVPFQVTVDCADPARLTRFWAFALGYVVPPPPDGAADWSAYWRSIGVPEDELDDGDDRLVDPTGRGPAIWFQRVPEPKRAKNRLHLDLDVGGGRSVPRGLRRDRVEARTAELLGAGARRLRTLDAPGVDSYAVVLADPEGNEFCLR